MELLGSPPSPYTRKVRLVAALKNVAVRFVTTNTADPEGGLRQQNPLGKIPVLVLPDGTSLYDSRVIVEYLDSLGAEPKLFPQGEARWPALRCQALGDGICDAALLQIYEKRFRPQEIQSADWVAMQAVKVAQALAYLEKTDTLAATRFTIGEVAVAAALGYLDLRFAGAWRDDHPKLAGWLGQFAAQVPAFGETAAD
ncbi:MAG: glutathione S-transferase family protein [Alphaproteobacteria bacterium]